MALKLPEHSHCTYCGDPVPYGEQFCNQVCRDAHVKEEKRTRIRDFAFYAIIAVALVVILYGQIF